MARSSKKKAAPSKSRSRSRPKGRASETEQKAVQKARKSPFRGASETERKAAVPAREGRRAAPRGVSETERKVVQKPAKKSVKKATQKVAKKAPKRVRDYAKEYRRRMQRAEALKISKNIARGHPRREAGEVGRAELKDLRTAARVDSPGDQREKGVKRPKSAWTRVWARERVAELAGLTDVPAQTSTDATRRGPAVETFAAKFVELGLGTISQAYHLWFSP